MHACVVIMFLASLQRVQYMKEFIVRMDEQMAREQPMKKTTLRNFVSASTSLTHVTLVVRRQLPACRLTTLLPQN